MIEIQQFVPYAAAFVHGNTIIGDACNTACAEPFDIRDIRYPDCFLDTALDDLESDGTGRHGTYIEDSQHIDCLSHDAKPTC